MLSPEGSLPASAKRRVPHVWPVLDVFPYLSRHSFAYLCSVGMCAVINGGGIVSDLAKDAASMAKGSAGLRGAPHHTAKPLHDFKAASHDLSALGALGSLLKATGEIRDGMNTLSALTTSLGEEWNAEAKLLGEVSDAFDLLDVLLSQAARGKKG
jgi:hypothetical protein